MWNYSEFNRHLCRNIDLSMLRSGTINGFKTVLLSFFIIYCSYHKASFGSLAMRQSLEPHVNHTLCCGFDPRVTGSLMMRCVPKPSWVSTRTFQFSMLCLISLHYFPQSSTVTWFYKFWCDILRWFFLSTHLQTNLDLKTTLIFKYEWHLNER